MSSVNEQNAVERERIRAQRIVLAFLADFNTKAADKAEVLAKHGHKNVPILFMQSEIQDMLWNMAHAMKNETNK